MSLCLLVADNHATLTALLSRHGRAASEVLTVLRRPPDCAACPMAAFSLRLLIAVVRACNAFQLNTAQDNMVLPNSEEEQSATLLSV